MGGEDLLAQRGAGARHADDEHRRRIGIARARTVAETRAGEAGDAGIDECAMRIAGERLHHAQQRVALGPLREGAAVLSLRRPEFREIITCHDPMLEHRIRPHVVERRLLPGRRQLRRRPVAAAERQQHLPPVPVRQQRARDRADPDERIQAGRRRIGLAQLQKSQRTVCRCQ